MGLRLREAAAELRADGDGPAAVPRCPEAPSLIPRGLPQDTEPPYVSNGLRAMAESFRISIPDL